MNSTLGIWVVRKEAESLGRYLEVELGATLAVWTVVAARLLARLSFLGTPLIASGSW